MDLPTSPPPYEDVTGYNSRYARRNNRQQQAISFFDTVKTFFGSFGRKFRRKSTASEYARLKHTELDNPGLIFCASCNTTHRRPVDEHCLDIGGPSCVANTSSQKVQLGGSRSLSWWQAHLAMRAERFSPAHGIALCGRIEEWDCWDWNYAYCIKAINDRLLVKVVATKSFGLMEMYEGLEDSPCCVHLEASKKFDQLMRNAILDCVATSTPERAQSVLFRCAWCPSEFRIAVLRCNSDEKAANEGKNSALREECYRLIVSRYIHVGRCESIKSREWIGLTTWKARLGLGSLHTVSATKTIERQWEGWMRSRGEIRIVW